MDNTVEENIDRIYKKFQQLLKQYQLLQKENAQQASAIQQLTATKETDTKKINALQQQVIILKAATGQMNEKDKKEFEKNINQYLKEIEKCINLLSE
jgi:predicted transcriptional regulator